MCCCQQKICNVSETGQDRTKVTIDDQQEVTHALSIVPTNLDDLERPLRTLFQNTYVFGTHYEYLNEDKPTLWWPICSAMSLVSGNKVYGDIRGGYLERGVSVTR